MLDTLTKTPGSAETADDLGKTKAPALVPGSVAEMLDEAENLVELMQSEPPETVAVLAKFLAVSARKVGRLDIAEAADMMRRKASPRRGPVDLTRSMRRLTDTIAAANAARAAA